MASRIVARALRERAPETRSANLRLLVDADHYETLIERVLPEARVSVWIGTANLKELRIEAPIGTRARARGRYVSVLETFESLANRGVELRVLHGRPPSRAFRSELSARPRLREKLIMKECPRVHLKVIAVDGSSLYLGSANFTGAGIGARSDKRRNFEIGVVTDDEHLLDVVQERFDAIWSGRECGSCGLRSECPRPIDMLVKSKPPASARRSRSIRIRPT